MSHFGGVHFTGVHFSTVQFDTLAGTDGELNLVSTSVLGLEAEVGGSRELNLPTESFLVMDGTRQAAAETLDVTTVSTLTLDPQKIGEVWTPVPYDESERWTPVEQERVDVRTFEEETT